MTADLFRQNMVSLNYHTPQYSLLFYMHNPLQLIHIICLNQMNLQLLLFIQQSPSEIHEYLSIYEMCASKICQLKIFSQLMS